MFEFGLLNWTIVGLYILGSLVLGVYFNGE